MGLTAVTSWVVSSISVWLVPVYIGAMILIFATPRTNRPKAASKDEVEAGESSPVEDPLASATAEVKEEATAEPPAPAAEAEPAGDAPPKPRKRRVRARKSAKKGADAPDGASESGRVTWVRVGPGKFVRSVVPVAEFVGPPAPESASASDSDSDSDSTTEPEPSVEEEAGAGEPDGPAVPLSVEEPSQAQPQPESTSIADDSHPAPGLGPDGGSCQDLWMNQDDQARFVEASEETISPDPLEPEAAAIEAAEFAIEHEHESEFASPDVSEAIAEEHGNAPSTLGEGPETALDFEAGRDEEPWSAFASPYAAEAIVDVEVDRRETVGLLDSPKVDANGRRAGFSLFFSASLRRPRRTVEPAVVRVSRRLGNVRRPGASQRATLAGRADETRVRHRVESLRSRRANVQRDYHPRSPPARS